MAAPASAHIPARPHHRGPDGFNDFEQEFFRAGEAVGVPARSASCEAWSWRRAIVRIAALTVFSAALVMACNALGPTVRHELRTRTQVDGVALRAQLVGKREAWAHPVQDTRPASPRQRPHSTTAARNRRR